MGYNLWSRKDLDTERLSTHTGPCPAGGGPLGAGWWGGLSFHTSRDLTSPVELPGKDTGNPGLEAHGSPSLLGAPHRPPQTALRTHGREAQLRG